MTEHSEDVCGALSGAFGSYNGDGRNDIALLLYSILKYSVCKSGVPGTDWEFDRSQSRNFSVHNNTEADIFASGIDGLDPDIDPMDSFPTGKHAIIIDAAESGPDTDKFLAEVTRDIASKTGDRDKFLNAKKFLQNKKLSKQITTDDSKNADEKFKQILYAARKLRQVRSYYVIDDVGFDDSLHALLEKFVSKYENVGVVSVDQGRPWDKCVTLGLYGMRAASDD